MAVNRRSKLALAGAGWAGRVHGLAAEEFRPGGVAVVAAWTIAGAESLAASLHATPVASDELPAGADAVIVAVPTAAHAALAGPPHASVPVLIEVPLADTLAECDEIIGAAQRSGTAARYAENLLFSPALDLAAGRTRELGPLEHLDVQIPDPHRIGGASSSPCRPVVRSSISGRTRWRSRSRPRGDDPPVAGRCRLGSNRVDHADDAARVEIRFGSGLIGAVDVGWAGIEPVCAAQAASATGTVRVEFQPILGVEANGEPLQLPGATGNRTQSIERVRDLGYSAQLAGFVSMVAGDGGRVCPAGFGRSILEVICAAYTSAGRVRAPRRRFRSPETARVLRCNSGRSDPFPCVSNTCSTMMPSCAVPPTVSTSIISTIASESSPGRSTRCRPNSPRSSGRSTKPMAGRTGASGPWRIGCRSEPDGPRPMPSESPGSERASTRFPRSPTLPVAARSRWRCSMLPPGSRHPRTKRLSPRSSACAPRPRRAASSPSTANSTTFRRRAIASSLHRRSMVSPNCGGGTGSTMRAEAGSTPRLNATTLELVRQAFVAVTSDHACEVRSSGPAPTPDASKASVDELARRVAAAAIEQAQRFGSRGAGGESFAVQITVDLATLAAALGIELNSTLPVQLGRQAFITGTNGRITQLSDEQLARALCDAKLQMLVHHNGVPLWLGNEVRNATRHQRRALRHRSGGACEFPSCTATRHLEPHHVRHHEHGGATSLDNLLLLCWHHHHELHRHGWAVRSIGHQQFAIYDAEGACLGSTTADAPTFRTHASGPSGTRPIAHRARSPTGIASDRSRRTAAHRRRRAAHGLRPRCPGDIVAARWPDHRSAGRSPGRRCPPPRTGPSGIGISRYLGRRRSVGRQVAVRSRRRSDFALDADLVGADVALEEVGELLHVLQLHEAERVLRPVHLGQVQRRRGAGRRRTRGTRGCRRPTCRRRPG